MTLPSMASDAELHVQVLRERALPELGEVAVRARVRLLHRLLEGCGVDLNAGGGAEHVDAVARGDVARVGQVAQLDLVGVRELRRRWVLSSSGCRITVLNHAKLL